VEDEVYFRGLMYSNDIWVNLDPKINRCYWEYISSLYLSGDKYIEYYPIDRLLKYMADLTKEILKKKACCNLHSWSITSPTRGVIFKLTNIIDPIIYAVKTIILGWSHDDLPVIKDASALLKALLRNDNPCYLLSILQLIDDLV